MLEIDHYEIVRQKLSLGSLYAPKHKKIFELMKILWNGEEIEILSKFEGADKYTSVKALEKSTGISKDKLVSILDKLYNKGTIAKVANVYGLVPILPGIFERYFIRRTDSKENLTKVAELYRWYFKIFMPSFLVDTNLKFFRPRLPTNAREKLIEIDESLGVDSQILPYELVSQLIDNYDIFTVIPCQCRLIAEYTGDPCQIAAAEMGCFLAGEGARSSIERGAPMLNKEEAAEYLKKTEKAGLIHSCVADSSVESTLFICNCCSCHCGALVAAKEHKYYATLASNYAPKIDTGLCTKCEICLNKCPMGVIYHKFPNEPDSSDEHMFINEDFCLGCGVCAANCPNDAIKLVKIRDNISQEKFKFGTKTFSELV